MGDFWYEAGPDDGLPAEDRKRRDELKARARVVKDRLKQPADAEESARLRDELADIYAQLTTLEPQRTARGSVWLCLRRK